MRITCLFKPSSGERAKKPPDVFLMKKDWGFWLFNSETAL